MSIALSLYFVATARVVDQAPRRPSQWGADSSLGVSAGIKG